MAPSIVKKGELFDITIRAIDKDNNTVKDYQGPMSLITNLMDDTVTNHSKTINFNSEDGGYKKFSNIAMLNLLGTQRIYVADINTSIDIVGKFEITVVAQ